MADQGETAPTAAGRGSHRAGTCAPRAPRAVRTRPGTGRRRLRTAVLALLDGVHDPVPTLVDLHCGSGASTRELLRVARRRDQSPRIIGLDPSPRRVLEARAGHWPPGVLFLQGSARDVTGLALPPAHGILAHQLGLCPQDLTGVFTSLYRTLVPGGLLLVHDVLPGPAGQDLDVVVRALHRAGFHDVASRAPDSRAPGASRLLRARA